MEMLQVDGSQIVDARGQPVRLRGTCVGGWMNMEDFIDGYPGAESGLRRTMAETLGAERAQFFFDCLLDHFLGEEDLAFIRSCGANVVRLSLNYHHFERDEDPFQYLESGFERLGRAVDWCGKHGLYAILDLHAVQGCQNTDWHCDNSSRHTFFWSQRQNQDRYVTLWEEIARRFRGNAAIAGYNVMNEPVTNAPLGRFSHDYTPNWPLINHVYRRVVGAIRAIDPDHIIFLEGDLFSSLFSGLEPPFAPNLVYSSHNYTPAGFGPGPYPGLIRGKHWDLDAQQQAFQQHEGYQYARRHNVPLWVGEFGSVYNGTEEEIPDRLRALDDQLTVYDEAGVHWTTWTYKDVGVMGWVQLQPEAEYLQRIRSVLEAKRLLSTDFWMSWLPPTQALEKVGELASMVEKVLDDPNIDPTANRHFLAQASLSGYVANLMQPVYTRCFTGLDEAELERVLQSFAFQSCRPFGGLVEVLKRHLA